MVKLLTLARRVLIALVVLVVAVVVLTNRDRFRTEDTLSADSTPAVAFDTKVADLPGVRQVLVVSADDEGSTRATVTGYDNVDGNWIASFGPVGAMIGRAGFAQPADRQESQGTTPIGRFAISGAFGRDAAPDGTAVPYTLLQPGDCWISDTNDVAYNRWVYRPECVAPNVDLYNRAAEGGPFRRGILLEFNTDDRVVGRGSAIFIHQVERDGDTPLATYGGVALGGDALEDLIGWLRPSENPLAVIGPTSWITAPP